MKYLEHKFFELIDRPIFNDDVCIYCNKSSSELFKNIDEFYQNKISKEFEDNYHSYSSIIKSQIEFLKNNTNCITEEEYLIKRLLE